MCSPKRPGSSTTHSARLPRSLVGDDPAKSGHGSWGLVESGYVSVGSSCEGLVGVWALEGSGRDLVEQQGSGRVMEEQWRSGKGLVGV